ncbi:hypothetical protein BDV25DRAFT_162647 [Aspergillus avenaceus]|uniref:Sigma-70 region 2 family protein n=1 Tax=Aspergillus avenaceus TaxID=36643 RepID=A0A5N6TJ31_ASPAV|nr:hypothetical protein BDV25DRAFT_162647 [Aspergillus avenaceus]
MSNEPDGVASDTSAAGPSNIQWQFIDASNNSRSNLTQVKRHVMQQYMRQKRASDPPGEDPDKPEASHPSQRKAGRPSKGKGRGRKKGKQNESGDNQGQKGQESISEQQFDSTAFPDHAWTDDFAEEIERDFAPGDFEYANAEQYPSLASTTFAKAHGYLLSPHQMDSYMYGCQSTGSESSLSPSCPTSPSDMALSPRSLLSAARTDPFNALPMDLDAEGHRFFDFYVNEMPACSYGTHFRSAKAHNWYTAVFVPMGMKGAVAFQNTILVHAANTWAWVRNEEETDYTLVHRNRSISMLRDHMERNPGDISDVAIIACLSAAGLEDFDPRPGRKEISWVHMRAAREMIRARGGPVAFENTRLGMLINWQDYILSGYETNGLSFFFELNPSVAHSSKEQTLQQDPIKYALQLAPAVPSLSTWHAASSRTRGFTPLSFLSPEDEIQHQCNEFIHFLQRSEQLCIHHKTRLNVSLAPMRHVAFQETSLLHSILAAPPGLRFTASGNRKQFVARLVALIMLNAALWDYRYSLPHSETFLWSLEQAVLASEVNTSGSVEALLQIMLECNDGIETVSQEGDGGPDFTQYSPTAKSPYGRPWFAGRMLKVAKRLSLNSWMIVHDFLFSCLTMQPQTSVSLWEGELRREVLSAPLTCYVMPALAEQ